MHVEQDIERLLDPKRKDAFLEIDLRPFLSPSLGAEIYDEITKNLPPGRSGLAHSLRAFDDFFAWLDIAIKTRHPTAKKHAISIEGNPQLMIQSHPAQYHDRTGFHFDGALVTAILILHGPGTFYSTDKSRLLEIGRGQRELQPKYDMLSNPTLFVKQTPTPSLIIFNNPHVNPRIIHNMDTALFHSPPPPGGTRVISVVRWYDHPY